jgi:hypothetical protein
MTWVKFCCTNCMSILATIYFEKSHLNNVELKCENCGKNCKFINDISPELMTERIHKL